MTQVLLLCCAGTASARNGAFATPDEPLDEGGRRKAAAFRLPRPAPARLFGSPAAIARETAGLAGLTVTTERRLADVGYGDWAGRSFAAVQAGCPEEFAAWLAAPQHGTPGGESLDRVVHRVGEWLGEQATAGGTVLGVTHPMVVRAALAMALAVPPAATMRIDLPPLGLARLSFNRGWRLQALSPPPG